MKIFLIVITVKLFLIVIAVLLLYGEPSEAAEKLKREGNKVVTVNEFGETQHNKQKYVVKDNCLVPIDMFEVIQHNARPICFVKK